jgi:hypothetical protein
MRKIPLTEFNKQRFLETFSKASDGELLEQLSDWLFLASAAALSTTTEQDFSWILDAIKAELTKRGKPELYHE